MTLSLMPNPNMQFFGNDGNPLSGGYLYTYVAGRPGFPKVTYPNNNTVVQNTNPIILDSAGRCTVWIDGYYTMELWTGEKGLGASTLVWSADNISNPGAGTLITQGYTVITVNNDPMVRQTVVIAGGDGDPQVTVVLPTEGEITVIKNDATIGTIQLSEGSGCIFATVASELTVQYESVTYEVIESVYYEK